MNNFLIRKNLILIFLALLALGGVFIFREKLSRLLSFKSTPVQTHPFVLQDLTAGKSASSSVPEEKPMSGAGTEAGQNNSSGSFPAYAGRAPDEIRPQEKEISIFGEEQRNKIYAQIRMYGESVKKHPDFLYGWNALGLDKEVIGDYEGARDAWYYAGVTSPLNSVSFANLADLYWHYLPDYALAEKNFLISIKNKPNDPSTYLSLSDFYYYSDTAKQAEAESILLKGLEANPGDLNLTKALAVLYEKKSEYVKAIEWWKKVLALDPNNKEVAAEIDALEKK